MAAVFNLLGAFVSTKVATTVGKGIVDTDLGDSPTLVLAALVGAIVWNLITWYFGIPSARRTRLSAASSAPLSPPSASPRVLWSGVLDKDHPAHGPRRRSASLAAWLLMIGSHLARAPPRAGAGEPLVPRLQPFSAAFMAFSHGTNDAQKTMGVITLALLASRQDQHLQIPLWVIVACGLAMAAGTLLGRLAHHPHAGSKVIKLDPIHGFAAETSAATVIQLATHFGFPVSTTHTITAAIMGTGATQRLSAVRWGVAGNIVTAWILTLPAAGSSWPASPTCIAALSLVLSAAGCRAGWPRACQRPRSLRAYHRDLKHSATRSWSMDRRASSTMPARSRCGRGEP